MATVIRDSEAARQASVFSLGDYAAQAKAIVEQGRRDAEAVVARARIEAEQVRAEAVAAGREEGFAAGVEAGRQAALEDGRKLFEQQAGRAGRLLADMIDKLNRRKEKVLADARGELVALALAVAEKVIRKQIAADPQTCQRRVDAAVELAGAASRISLKVNPDDLEEIRALAPKLADRLGGQAEVQVAADAAVERGGCRLAGWREAGQVAEIDARIETQIARIAAELTGGTA